MIFFIRSSSMKFSLIVMLFEPAGLEDHDIIQVMLGLLIIEKIQNGIIPSGYVKMEQI